MFPAQRTRSALYVLLFMVSAVLLGLTAKRLHDTKTFTSSYDPVVAELLSASILGVIWSLWGAFVSSRTNEASAAIILEAIFLFILFMMFCVGAAVAVDLECFDLFEKCSILRALQGFAWICWGITFAALICNVIQIVFEERYRSGSGSRATRRRKHQQMSEAPQMT